MNKKQEVKQNLKHGYIFLILTLLTPFSIALFIELYSIGQLNFPQVETPISYPIDNPDPELVEETKPKLEIKNLTDGFNTKETSVVVVASTDIGNEAWVNNNKVTVAGDGNFEYKIELIEGKNAIELKVKNEKGIENGTTINVNREAEKKSDPIPANPQPAPVNQQPNPTPQPQPNPTAPSPTPEPPAPSPVTGLRMNCSITNTNPFVGQSVGVNCNVKDQNENPLSSAFGYVTVNWQSGTGVYTLSQSDGGGNMAVSISVPAGNSGNINGSVQVSKSGLNVSSNFTIRVN